MEKPIPAVFSEVARCFARDVLEDGTELVGLCTSSGQLLELIGDKVHDSCDLEKNADDIQIFTSYDPHQKYYLVLCQKQLVVIKRCTPLSVIKTYENVIRVKISDRLRLGRPQAVIWTLAGKEPIVTDFVSHLEAKGPKVVSNITLHLSGKLQEMNERLVKARKVLQEKRHARLKALYQSTPNLTPSGDELEVETKELVLGPPFPLDDEVPPQPAPLRLSCPWARAHNGKWIVGIPAFNASDMAVDEVRLRLSVAGESTLHYRTQVLVFTKSDGTGEGEGVVPFQTLTGVPAHTAAVITGVMDELPFKSCSVISVCGHVFYKTSGDTDGKVIQDLLESEVKFTVEDLVKGTLTPFSSSPEEANESDLSSVVVSSGCWRLEVMARYRLSSGLRLSDHGLWRAPALGCWAGPRGGGLWGLLLYHHQISTTQHRLTVYARDSKQVLLLVQCLLPQWRVGECPESAAGLGDCIRSLEAELRLLLSVAQDKPTDCEGLRRTLCSLELATDLTFASYRRAKYPTGV